ncbi:HAD family hydrolase [Jannaschia sp. LMIT008]|uniref:sulfotransferase-like domain-containing protein n=1 Tax=Jannaschia maritima TaxID=3032585 RepID=UPI002811A6CF|nr:HAD family hydrolase [Jannaschia sp. LMIT008]
MRVAAWSGPRNLSTAMMYAFAQRPGWRVLDEPFYAAFLHRTGLDHPMRDAVLAAQPTDPAAVAAALRDAPARTYAKLMVHHMDGVPLGWAEGWTHLHLIRHPARVIASYGAKRGAMTEGDIGFAAQAALYDRLGGVVLDTADMARDPAGATAALCAALGLDPDDAMLSWPAGPKPYDGAWAPHWYDAAHRSTGLRPRADDPLPRVADARLLRSALPFYDAMRAHAIRV